MSRIVFCHTCLDDGIDGLCNGRIVQIGFILGQSGIILAGLMQVFLVFILPFAVAAGVATSAVVVATIVRMVMSAVTVLVVVLMPTFALVFLIMFHNA